MVRSLKIQVLLIIISSNICAVVSSLTLEQRVESLEKNGKTAEAKVGALENKVKSLETEVQKLKETNMAMKTEVDSKMKSSMKSLEANVTRLEEKVKQMELQLLLMAKERQRHKSLSTSVEANMPNSMSKHVFHRTCHEARAANSSLVSGMHWIDPDGRGVGDEPIHVHCNMTTGTTSILHDSEREMNVGHCADRGCYSRSINYYASNRQIAALTELSTECHQSIKYDCISAPFNFNGAAFSWWNDKFGNPQYFWSGSNASAHTCRCGTDRNCFEPFLACNCDSILPTDSSDHGIITAMKLLPVTKLNFGRTQVASSSGIHTLGRLECSGHVAVSGMPKSCKDLWQIGHTLSGLYSVKGAKQIESVYCDFTKLSEDVGFQTWIGFADVKSLPVYFYVQRNTTFKFNSNRISFELERLNVGGAMNITSGIFTAPRPGNYFFSFSGNSHDNDYLLVGLYVNDELVGTGNSQTVNNTLTIQSTLHLNTGNQVSVKRYVGNGYLHGDITYRTHFTGWLLQEDLSF